MEEKSSDDRILEQLQSVIGGTPLVRTNNTPKEQNNVAKQNDNKKQQQNHKNKNTKSNGNEQQPKQTKKQSQPKPKKANNQNQKQPKANDNAEIVKKADKSPKVKITFLGGVGEIGKNMTAFEYGDEMIVVDCGMAFPSDDLPGVDVVVPDITYLLQNKNKLKAFIVTHGHEDHIGSIPFVLGDLNVPIYGSRLSLGLIENKLKEFPKLKYKLVAVKPKQVLKIGNFAVEFVHVNHSIAGSLALSITTPCGTIFHTGDFKIDFEPVTGDTTDLSRIAELGRRGINLLMCESTNVCRPGYSMSESNVGRVMDEIFEKHPNNRLFVATFASNVQRMQQILDLAEKYKRKVAFSGRSMINVSEVASKLGELKYNKENIIDIDKVSKYDDKEVLIMATGSQGESMSALSRMAAGEFKGIELGENDCIILSSSPIPGNEKSVYGLINTLFKKGADVIYDELAEVHASGHACQEEIKIIHKLTKPVHFMPIHGEYRHLKQHKELAISMGTDARNIILPDLGMQVEMSKNSIKQVGYVQAGLRLVDGLGVGDLSSAVLRDRIQLSEEGVCVAVVNLSSVTGELVSDPFIITRGVVYNDEADDFNQDARACLSQLLKSYDLKDMDQNEIKNTVKKTLSNFIFRRTKRRPMILTVAILG